MPRDQHYPTTIATLHRELGIPSDYAQQRNLELFAEADHNDLVNIARKPDGADIQLITEAAAAWQRMQAGAERDDITLLPLSGYRSVARQAELIRGKLARGFTITETLQVMAAPGYSEHHTARALDIGTPDAPPLEEAFALTSAFAWLQNNAAMFGFRLSYPRNNPHGIVFEPWHWCWPRNRVKPAQEITSH